MFESCHTTALALDVLNNQPDAHKILGDLLEETGDTAGAQFARGDRKTPRKRLDLAIGLLPMLAATRLACDFFVHICAERPSDFSFIGPDQLAAIERIQLWCDDPQSPDGVLTICADLRDLVRERPQRRLLRLGRTDYARPQVSGVLDTLPAAVTAAHSAAEAGDISHRLAGRTAVAIGVKKTAAAAREVAALTQYESYTNRIAWQKELEWQTEHTKDVFSQLL